MSTPTSPNSGPAHRLRDQGWMQVVLRRELGVTTCHVFPDGERGELADLVLGGKPGSELRITPCHSTASIFWAGEVTR